MIKQKKIALKTFEGKRYYFDKFNSAPWGHNLAGKMTQRVIVVFIKRTLLQRTKKGLYHH